MAEDSAADSPLLDVQDLRVTFANDVREVPVVDGVSLRVPRGRTVALVGESGCGKSVTALSIMRLIPQPPGRIAAGRVLLADHRSAEPVDLLQLPEREMPAVRGKRVAMIFQEPFASLTPVYSIGDQLIEALTLHRAMHGSAARAAAVELLDRVGIGEPAQRLREYPHQLSGGMCQRVMIAMALAGRPELLIADEPTTALDVTVQLQILDLMRSLQAQTGMGIIMITHDLGVVAEVADYVYVMYAGRIVEHAPTASLLTHPLHPYTNGLLRCIPRLDDDRDRLEVIPGRVPDPADLPAGCPFHPRCDLAARLAESAGKEAADKKTAATCASTGCEVLSRCAGVGSGESAGPPGLTEIAEGHCVACWEAHS